MFGGLRKKLEELTAQANPFDGGKTAATVRAARTNPAPARTVKAAQPARPMSTQQRVDQSYGAGFGGVKNRLRDVFDANTEADKIKRFSATGLAESFAQEQARKTQAAQNDPTKRSTVQQITGNALGGLSEFAKLPSQAIKMKGNIENSTLGKAATFANPTTQASAIADELWKRATGQDTAKKRNDLYAKVGGSTEEAINNKIQQSGLGNRNTDNRIVAGVSRAGGQLLGQVAGTVASGGSTLPSAAMGLQTASSQYDQARKAGKSNDYAVNTGLGQGIVSGALEKVGFDKLGGSGNRLINAVRGFGTEGAQEGVQQLAQNLITNRTYNPNQGIKEGVAESALIGGITGGVAGPLMGTRPATPKPTTSLVAPKPEPTRTRLRPEEARIWSDYQETLYKGNRMPAQVVNETHNKARKIADSLGVDIITGSPDEIAGRMNPLLEQSIAFQKEPTTGLVSRARSRLTPLNEGGYISLGAPEPKKLPQDIKDQFSKQGSFGREAMDRLEANKISKGDLERAGVVFDPKQVKKIAQTLPEFKANPVMTYRKGDYSYTDAGYGRYPVPEKARSGVFEFKHSRGTMRLNPEALFGKEMAQKLAQTAKDGEQVDFTDTMKASGNRLFTYDQTPDKPTSTVAKPVQKQVTEKQNSVDSLESLKQEAKEIKTRTIKTAEGKNEYVAQLGNSTKDRVGRQTGFKATETSPNFKSEGEMNAWIKKNIDTQSQPPKSTQAKPPTPFEQNLQTAGLKPIQKNVLTAKLPAQTQDQLATSPNQGSSKQQTQKTESGSSKLSPIPQVSEKTNASVSLQPSVQRTNESSKGLILAEREAPNGQRIQKVRTGKGVVEQRTVADQIGDALGMTQDQREPSFNAVAAAKNSSSAKRLVEALNMNDDITQAAAQAQQDGKEINFFAKKDANGRSVGVERFDPQYHKIDAGFVTDRNGNVLGNHIKVDSTGVQVNVGGDVVNMDRVLGNPINWKNKYEASSTMERNIYQNAPTKEIADKTYKFTVGHKIQSEANYKTELQQQRKALTDRTKATLAAKPRRVKSEEYKADLFDFIENTSTYTDMVGKYGQSTAKVMSDYKTSTRTMYNDLLKRVNEQFGKFGMEQVPQRKDYLTHINELMDKKSYVGELVGQLQNSIADEGKDRTRGAIPTDIAGRSENFKPTKKWNRFFQERRGGEFTKDPFKAVDAYLEPTLHNIHMTESGVRTRAVEATFRTVSQLKNMDTSYVQKELGDSLVKFKVQGGNDKLVRGFQEYANAITGKTEALDRQIIDKSDASATALRGWQKLQSVGGRATILGNLNSVLMQPLNQIATMAQTNPANYLKGIAATISGDKTYQQSPFLKARNAKVDSYFRSKGQKFLDKGAVPLELVEKAAIRNTWNAQYQSVLKDGYKGKEAITETDRRTERTVAGRGIADRPELYRSTVANGVLQYTLEVNAQNKMFWRDLTPVQKAEFMVASSGVNMILGAVTGNTPMPDFIKAVFDSVMDFADGEDDDSVLENAGQAVQRVAGEAASMNPLVSAGANLLPKSARQVAFGKESDLGRYDGTSAPVQVVKNVVDTGSKLAQGKYTDARNSALKTVPFGNQIQKTWRGAEAISEGKTEGSPWQAAKAIAFGPNAINTDTAKETRFSATPSKSKGTVNASSVDGKATFAPTVDEILKSQFSTKEQKAWLKLSAADRKAEAEQDPEKAKWLKQYEATKRVNKNAPERPEGLSKESETILNWHNKRTPQQREKLAYTQNDYDYKLATAQFEEAKLNGTVSRAEMINKQQALAKAKVGKDFTKDTRESYNSLSKAELTTLAENDPNGKQIMADAIAYGDALVKAGLIKKNKLRTGSGSGGRRGGRGGKGKASKFDYTKNLFDSGSNSASTSKQLRAILEKAMSGKS